MVREIRLVKKWLYLHYSSWLRRGQSGALPQWCSRPQPCRDCVSSCLHSHSPLLGTVTEPSSYWSECIRFLTALALQKLAGVCVVWCGSCAVNSLETGDCCPWQERGELLAGIVEQEERPSKLFVSCITCKFKMGRCLSTVFNSRKGINPSKSLPFVTHLEHKTQPQKPRWPEIPISQLTRTCSPWRVVLESFLHHPQQGAVYAHLSSVLGKQPLPALGSDFQVFPLYFWLLCFCCFLDFKILEFLSVFVKEEQGLAFFHSLGLLPPPSSSDIWQFLVTSVSNVYIIVAISIIHLPKQLVYYNPLSLSFFFLYYLSWWFSEFPISSSLFFFLVRSSRHL